MSELQETAEASQEPQEMPVASREPTSYSMFALDPPTNTSRSPDMRFFDPPAVTVPKPIVRRKRNR